MMTPADVCEKLKISGSTLRKYAIEFELQGIKFRRNNKNARLFTVTEATSIHNAMKAAQSGLKSFEDAVTQEVRVLKGNPSITTETPENAVAESSASRHDDSATVVITDEIKSLKEEIRQRDSLFVELLEKMEKQQAERDKKLLSEISELKSQVEQQKQIGGQSSDAPNVNGSELQPQQPKKGIWARLFKN